MRALSILVGLGTMLVAQAVGPAAAAASAPDFPADMSGYHNYPEMVGEIKQAEVDFPDIVHVFSIGKSYQGREIWAAKISDNVATDEDEPEVLIDALHHAREHLTTEQALALLRWLTHDYGTDADRHAPRRHPRDVHHLRAQPRRHAATTSPATPFRAWRKNRQPNPGPQRRHRPQPQLRLPVRLLQRLIGQPQVDHLPRRVRVLGARDAGPARLRAEPRRPRRPADPDPHHAPHQRRADPVAVRLHEDERPARHDGPRPPDLRVAGPGDGDDATATRPSSRPTCTSPTATRSTGCTRSTGSSPTPSSCSRPRSRPSGATTTPTTRRSPSRPPATARRSCCSSTARPARTRRSVPTPGGRTAGRCSTTSRSTAAGSATPRATTRRRRGCGRSRTRRRTTRARREAAGRRRSRDRAPSSPAPRPAGRPARYDVDHGTTSIRSRPIALPADAADYGPLTFQYSFAHSAASTTADSFRVQVEAEDGTRTTVFERLGAPTNLNGSWRSASASLADWAGQTIRLVVVAKDGANAQPRRGPGGRHPDPPPLIDGRRRGACRYDVPTVLADRGAHHAEAGDRSSGPRGRTRSSPSSIGRGRAS